MKNKKIIFGLVLVASVMLATVVFARPAGNGNQFDEWGYNYDANMFNGWYWNNGRPVPAYTKDTIDTAPSETQLIMKWSDEWMTTKCGPDNGHPAQRGCDVKTCECTGGSNIQGSWLTNHQWGSYLGNWDLTGDWIINVEYLGTDYPETLILTQSGTDITGVSLNTIPPASGSAFTIVSGSVTGNTVEIFADHDVSTLVVHMQGTIDPNGAMSGDWHDEAPGTRDGTWATTTGAATGKTCKWQYFVKMVHPGDGAYTEGGMWYTDATMETEIGTAIWGAYARILQVYNDPCDGYGGVENIWEAPTGFGYYG